MARKLRTAHRIEAGTDWSVGIIGWVTIAALFGAFVLVVATQSQAPREIDLCWKARDAMRPAPAFCPTNPLPRAG